MTKGVLYLLPNLLGDHTDHRAYLPAGVDEAVAQLDGLLAESERGGRRYLGRFITKRPAREIPIGVIGERLHRNEVDFFLEPLLKGEVWGLVSDAGLPCVADPGHELVAHARRLGIEVRAVAGPSSVMLALMLSGLPGQRFHFHGYLPKSPDEAVQALKNMEREVRERGSTQIFMEAPYRNEATLKRCLEVLEGSTLLCLASSLTTPEERVFCKPVAQWPKDEAWDLKRSPSLFLLNKL